MIVRYPEQNRDIYAAIEQVQATKSKVSLEVTKMGKALYSPKDLNGQFRAAFAQRGYHELRDTYTINVPNSPVSISGAFKEIDFVRDKVLVHLGIDVPTVRRPVPCLCRSI